MRFFFATFLLLIWLAIAPWIAKGYGEWHVLNPFVDHPIDIAVFYLLPVAAIMIGFSTFRSKRYD